MLELLLSLFAILYFILYLNNLSPQQPQKENSCPDCGHHQKFNTERTMN